MVGVDASSGHDEALGRALARYEQTRTPAAFDQAVGTAAAVVARLRGNRADEPADGVE